MYPGNEPYPFLTAADQAELHALADNEPAVQALRKLMLHALYHQGTLTEGKDPMPSINFALQLVAGANATQKNEDIGMRLRARYEGINFVEEGFQELGKFKTQVSQEKDKKNPAR